METLFSLFAVSPIDGRYNRQTLQLRDICSEYALLNFRIEIEMLWLRKLSMLKEIKILFTNQQLINKCCNNIIKGFNQKDALDIKYLETTINHDIKSIEYFLKKKLFKALGNNPIIEFIHFACTSEDINNLAYALMLKTLRRKVILPLWKQIIQELHKIIKKYYSIAILSRTHGQPATPSTIGKEFLNFSYRLERQLKQFELIKILGKINGSTGNYNAHCIAYPNVNWHKVSKEFVFSLGLSWNPYTTQIEPHDFISEFFSCISRFNTILININRDIWSYISLNYFVQKVNLNEVGSSVMPHKINPINFENSEGNLGISNVMISFFVEKLPISRWQRDLSDSTILRNIGSVVAYSVIAYNSFITGIKKLTINVDQMLQDLNNHWEILAEPIQTVMRKYGMNDSYNELKKLTMGNKITAAVILDYIKKLNIPEEEKNVLMKLTPANYLGLSAKLAKCFKIKNQ